MGCNEPNNSVEPEARLIIEGKEDVIITEPSSDEDIVIESCNDK